MGNENNGVPKMPDSYKAAETGNCGFTKSNPRPWTDQEITWCEDLQDKGFTKAEIAESVGRTETSVSIKMKRLKKGSNTYNRCHLDEKYATNKLFAEKINPATVLDVFAGCNPYWKNLEGGVLKWFQMIRTKSSIPTYTWTL